jgi:hypothetical protein
MVAWGTEAIYADPLDPDAFGHALVTVLRYPKIARQLSRFGSHRARASFTWNGVAQQLVAMIQEVGEGSGRHRTAGVRAAARAIADVGPDVEWMPIGSP